MTQAPHIVVIGSANTDLVVTVPRIPAPGETVLGGALAITPGGKGANQAVAAARLGGRVTFVGRVGDDDFGRQALARFADDDVDVSWVSVTPGIASGVAMIAVAEGGGENSIVVAPGANALLSPEDVEAASAAFDEANAIVLSLEVPLETVSRAAELAAERGVPVVLNPAPACALPAALLSRITLLTPNETEARSIAGAMEQELTAVASALLDAGVATAVVTLGAAGSLIVTPDGIEHAPALAVRAIDTVAAGDCFTGALTVEIAAGRSLRDAVRFASAAAALKVTRRGAQAGIPTRAEVERFLVAEGANQT